MSATSDFELRSEAYQKGINSGTYAVYHSMAATRPAKAVRYLRSIRASLAKPELHPTEAVRLDDALAGILDGLRHARVCNRCGRGLTDPESIERGYGADCAAKLARATRA